ncbi:hypothetical protein COEREDRAFT_10219 [Coemansia reversa NRRL 1564]|uniref:RING-type domain-containing protein n=1 Tax=Coemansia reversa (strain ATCC 12441 / NRRL 1564) TaxID=763665 RepID=A0A2G5B6L1_COERN|nr:hypothetical protein COEREDRAFT_10219 [Coemansia reversa NRRL 1564]|eukprot:PIA14622.1 hypothetical protein COEREDRAFT_10219 [Coemansia reversa NRRL 1564]
MVCIICYESIFKTSTSSSTPVRERVDNPPAALGCGHAFHKQCIEEWFRTSERSTCPTCHKVHYGTVLKLFIDIDENDITAEAPRGQTAANSSSGSNRGGRKKQTAKRGGSRSGRGRGGSSTSRRDADNVIDDLYLHLGDLSISQGPEIAFMSAYGYSSFLQEELDSANSQLEDLGDTIKELEMELQTKKESYEEQLSLQENRYNAEIRELNRLSIAHRTHIVSLQRALEAKKEYIYAMEHY